MTQIKNGHNKLYVLTLPIAVSELHVPSDIEDTVDNRHHQWWSNGEMKNTTTKAMEIRVWATSPEQAIDNLSVQLHKLSNSR